MAVSSRSGYVAGWLRVARLGVLAAVILSTVAVGSGAFSAASASRETATAVVGDDTGIVALDDRTPGDVVAATPSGALTIDFTRLGPATGVNVASTYTLGDPDDPTGRAAFDLTNRDAAPRDVTIAYALAAPGSDDDPDANVEFRVFDASGRAVATASEETGGRTIDAGAGETYHVVVVVDTRGLDPGADLSGTLDVTAS